MEMMQEILLPSCGIALVTGIEEPGELLVPTCIDVMLTHDMPLIVPGDVTVDAYLKRLATGEGIEGEPVYYRIIKPLGGSEDGGPLTTGSGGHVNFSFTASDPGVYRIKVVFLGQGVQEIPLEVAYLRCPANPITCSEQRGDPCMDEVYCLEHLAECCPPMAIPHGVCCTAPPNGGGILPQTPRQVPTCGILCGQGLTQNVQGLEPD